MPDRHTANPSQLKKLIWSPIKRAAKSRVQISCEKKRGKRVYWKKLSIPYRATQDEATVGATISPLQNTLKIPAMDKVRLEVRETSRNSENPSPKARQPPILSVKTVYRRGESSVTRNNLSEVLRLSAGDRQMAENQDRDGKRQLQLYDNNVIMANKQCKLMLQSADQLMTEDPANYIH